VISAALTAKYASRFSCVISQDSHSLAGDIQWFMRLFCRFCDRCIAQTGTSCGACLYGPVSTHDKSSQSPLQTSFGCFLLTINVL
jgi:hypothetical protein